MIHNLHRSQTFTSLGAEIIQPCSIHDTKDTPVTLDVCDRTIPGSDLRGQGELTLVHTIIAAVD